MTENFKLFLVFTILPDTGWIFVNSVWTSSHKQTLVWINREEKLKNTVLWGKKGMWTHRRINLAAHRNVELYHITAHCMHVFSVSQMNCRLQKTASLEETYCLLSSWSCSRWEAARRRRPVSALTFPSVWSLENFVIQRLVQCRLWNSTPLQQHHNNNQDWVCLSVSGQKRTGWTQRWPGEKKTSGWGQRLGNWSLHSRFSLTEAHKGACMRGSSFESTEITTLSDIPVKMSCLGQSPAIS